MSSDRHGYDGPRGIYEDDVLVRHVDPVRVWRLTGDFDTPYPGLFAYQAVWPD